GSRMGSGPRGLEGTPRVLVIGCGFLGGHIATGLARRAMAARVLSRSFAPSAVRQLSRYAFLEGDVRNPLVLERALVGIDEVVYCIGGLQPAGAELEPERDAALMLTPLREVVAALSDRQGIALT